MNTRSTLALAHPLDAELRSEQRTAHHRFALIVRALLASTRPRHYAAAVEELPDEPTRRGNRLRRLFGRLARRPLQSGKSRVRGK